SGTSAPFGVLSSATRSLRVADSRPSSSCVWLDRARTTGDRGHACGGSSHLSSHSFHDPSGPQAGTITPRLPVRGQPGWVLACCPAGSALAHMLYAPAILRPTRRRNVMRLI